MHLINSDEWRDDSNNDDASELIAQSLGTATVHVLDAVHSLATAVGLAAVTPGLLLDDEFAAELRAIAADLMAHRYRLLTMWDQ